MAIGAVYTNMSKKEEKIFAQVNYFIPPIMLIFFVRGGMSLNFSVFAQPSSLTVVPFIVIVIIFLLVRFAGKYGGSYLGSVVTRQPKETRNYLGLGLIPQASVAIALATMAARTLRSYGDIYEDYAVALLAIILASSIIFEIVGPALAKLGLYLSHSYTTSENNEEIKTVNDEKTDEDEEAYTEAAEEYKES